MVECPICESPEAKSLFLLKGADVLECHHCSMIYVPTPAPEFTAVYKSDYLSHPAGAGRIQGYHLYRSEFGSHLMTFNKRIEECEKIISGRVGRMLDVGCALGHCGEAARRRGWDVYVTDVSEYAVIESREQFGLNGFISSPQKLSVKPARFDLITLYNVVAHLSHPLDLLKDIRRALSGHGVLHLITPNAQSFSARLMGRHWYHLKPDEHWLYFTPETLRTTLQRAGFEVLKIKPAISLMRINDILLRFEKYSKRWASWLRALAKFLGIADWRLKIRSGEMQAWARLANVPSASTSEVALSPPVKDILDIVCCSNCRSELQLFEESEAICTQCELSYEVISGVINFSKYAKRGKRKLVGFS